jgi:hypothetical protein
VAFCIVLVVFKQASLASRSEKGIVIRAKVLHIVELSVMDARVVVIATESIDIASCGGDFRKS